MKVKYQDLIEQSFDFPTEEFEVEEGELLYYDIPLMDLVKQYGTPLKFTYLPKITENIQKARVWFNVAITKADYQGKYVQCYCTKSSHFQFVMEEVLKNNRFLRVSKSTVLNLMKVSAIKPALNSRFTAVLFSGEQIVISRKYVPALKKALKGEA